MSAILEPVAIIDLVENGCDLLIEDFRDRRVIRNVLRSWLRPDVDVETVLLQIYWGLMLDTAKGVFLDVLGAYVGESRNSRLDDVYRQAIRVRVRINRSTGTTLDIYEVASMLSSSWTYKEYYPATFQITVDHPLDAAVFADAINRTRGGGIGLRVLVLTQPATERLIRGSALFAGYGQGPGSVTTSDPRRTMTHVRYR